MLYRIIDSFTNDGVLNQRIQFTVPLCYAEPEAKISIVANVTQKYDSSIHTHDKIVFPASSKPIAYVQGGPGFPCAVPVSNSSYTKVLLDQGYQIIYYDQRGTGLSSPIETSTLENKGIDYLLHFRADSIVEDLEIIRKSLFGSGKWLLLGQSYGGFCSFTYLSFYPESLKEVMLTGGVPPVGFTADDVYRQTYERTRERNIHYYHKYPQDVARVKTILAYLSENVVKLPNGGTLSVERFQQLGIRFGAQGGTDTLHQVVTEFHWALETLGKPTYLILNSIQNSSSFDTNILYALFQEAIYCDGDSKSNWAADRTRYNAGNEAFVFGTEKVNTSEPVFFTGEMVYKSMFDDYAELVPLKELAHQLHAKTNWSRLYDPKTLGTLTWEKVPVVGATYFYDQFVDFETTMKVKKLVFKDNGNLKQYITSEFFHNGLRADPEKVLGSLFKLLNCEVD